MDIAYNVKLNTQEAKARMKGVADSFISQMGKDAGSAITSPVTAAGDLVGSVFKEVGENLFRDILVPLKEMMGYVKNAGDARASTKSILGMGANSLSESSIRNVYNVEKWKLDQTTAAGAKVDKATMSAEELAQTLGGGTGTQLVNAVKDLSANGKSGTDNLIAVVKEGFMSWVNLLK